METIHYHHVRTLQGVKDRANRIMKMSTGKYKVRGNKSRIHMYHNVEGYDLVTFYYCHEESRWILVGYDVNDNIVEIPCDSNKVYRVEGYDCTFSSIVEANEDTITYQEYALLWSLEVGQETMIDHTNIVRIK